MAAKKTQYKTYTELTAHGAASKFGQLIGDAFADVVFNLIGEHLRSTHPEYILLEPQTGKHLVKLEMFGGTFRQMDNVIVPKHSADPVALFESKWLKDGRHHNDKGAWILQLKEVRKRYPSVRGAVANLAGFWTEGVAVMFEKEGKIKMVLVATDEEIYGTIQAPLNEYLANHDLEPLTLDVIEIRDSLPRAWDLANCLIELKASGALDAIAVTWLNFQRTEGKDKQEITGRHLVTGAIDQLLEPLPSNPKVETLEIALQISTGNTIYREFRDAEEAMQFIQTYFTTPKLILDEITPKKKDDTSETLIPGSSDE